MLEVPDFDDLPKVQNMPQGCAWGVFDKDGEKDRLGCLNFLTPAVVREAYKEARDGVSVSLNAPLDALPEMPPRKGLVHNIIDWRAGGADFTALDDEVEFNTQSSSQWDSLLHYPYQPSDDGTGSSGCFYYNNAKPTIDALSKSSQHYDPDRQLPSLDHWHSRGGLVGRGVLLDYRAYAEVKGISYSITSPHAITVADLEAIAAHQQTQLRPGDILIVRTGYMDDAEGPARVDHANMAGIVGLDSSVEMARWLWNHRFAAVAGDAPALEALEFVKTKEGSIKILDFTLHPYLLSLFGMNIGELWSLQVLGEHCARTKRYSFLLTSIPLNIPGLVGSPPNALAIF